VFFVFFVVFFVVLLLASFVYLAPFHTTVASRVVLCQVVCALFVLICNASMFVATVAFDYESEGVLSLRIFSLFVAS